MKLGKDCKWFEGHGLALHDLHNYGSCTREKFISTVTGELIPASQRSCAVYREISENFDCWEQKD